MPDVTLPLGPIDGLTRLPVSIAGCWTEALYGNLDYQNREWTGTAVASEPVVVVALASNGSHLYWAKGSKRDSASPSRLLQIRLTLMVAKRVGSEVWAQLRVGSADLPSVRSRVGASSAWMLVDSNHASTGEVSSLMRIEGEPGIDLGVLFLARKDVKGARKGLWSLRRTLASGVAEPWRTILAHGRYGALALLESQGKAG